MRYKKRQYEQNKHFKDYASIYAPIWVLLGVNQLILGILYRKELPVLTYGCCAFLLCCSKPADELTRSNRKERIRFSSICSDCAVFLVDSAWRCAVFQWWWIVFAVEVILIVITFFWPENICEIVTAQLGDLVFHFGRASLR